MADDQYKQADAKTIADLLAKFDGVSVKGTALRRVNADVNRESLTKVCQFIHDSLWFEHISVVMGNDMVDYMETIYLIDNYYTGVVIELTVQIPNDDLNVDSVTPIWEGANWHERETWELYGIVFNNHPKLERLLTPDTYEFYPFRKSYKLRGQE